MSGEDPIGRPDGPDRVIREEFHGAGYYRLRV